MRSGLESADSEDPPPLVEVLNEVEAFKLPEFQLPNGRPDSAKYQVYLSAKEQEVAAVRPPRDKYLEHEFLLIRLLAKVADIAEEVYASNRMMWPPNTDGSLPGTPWGQSWWLRGLIDAYLTGKAEGNDNR